jgi:hypothetical protein
VAVLHGRDFYYWSYKLHCLPATPPLASRLCRDPAKPSNLRVRASCPDASAILQRLMRAGDSVEIEGRGWVILRPLNLPRGVTFRVGGGGIASSGGELQLWRSAEREYLLTAVDEPAGGEAHEALLRGRKGAEGPCERLSEPMTSLSTDAVVEHLAAQLARCEEQGLCSFDASGRHWVEQRWFICKTCRDSGAPDGLGVCVACSTHCHAGHEMISQSVSGFYCDCAVGGYPSIPCQRQKAR